MPPTPKGLLGACKTNRLLENTSPIVAIVGPTGSGKSNLAIQLAEAFGGEIVGCDSVQVYRGLNIGSAKTPIGDRCGIRHHLMDCLDLDEEMTAGEYARRARLAIASIHRRDALPIVAGGTGFYFRALFHGLSPAPQRDESLRDRLRQTGARRPGALHRYLRLLDPAAARRIHAQDLQKLIRAIELSRLSGRTATAIQSNPRDAMVGIATLLLGLNPPRVQLRERLTARATRLFENGLIEECAALLHKGAAAESKPLQSIGYKQAIRFLQGFCTLREAAAETGIRTAQYAKRQMTWFRAEPGAVWLDGFGGDASIQNQAFELVREFLTVRSSSGC
jgi:tRNA dimethylallyltransferase